ncbi:putative Late embryogenesis abundant [Quillaja saponaria]|uniref:Late embryogenesis abundant n=1 Tax=Quillaja saponaria TaxID=32244 RepID=A0AAD7QFE9_QUISA|nr:putative Late embryogenesis abundant [Quillaja saponaria]
MGKHSRQQRCCRLVWLMVVLAVVMFSLRCSCASVGHMPTSTEESRNFAKVVQGVKEHSRNKAREAKEGSVQKKFQKDFVSSMKMNPKRVPPRKRMILPVILPRRPKTKSRMSLLVLVNTVQKRLKEIKDFAAEKA